MEEDGGGDGSMVCSDHPLKNNSSSGGGICAFCLQEKLGKLVSSSFPIAVFPAAAVSSSSESPSFRSAETTTINPPPPPTSLTPDHHQYYSNNRSKILYLLTNNTTTTHNKKKNNNIIVDSNANNNKNRHLVFKRSKSTATPRSRFMNDDNIPPSISNKQRRRFWSFLYLPKHSTKTISSSSSSFQTSSKVEETPCQQQQQQQLSFDRKVSRSRSVGCGSRSFSGDFFERISTGFGDCTLRRVESQREGKSKGNDCIKERVRCGGLFSGFMITSSSSSSSSSSYWVSSNPNEANNNIVKGPSVAAAVQHSRSKSWGWGLASPMRAFNKQYSSSNKREKQNPTPNLGAIPSLLSVRS